ncbi:hypothetical protein [Parachitinimonas caeni]|uniref:Uncharacterized protein n=1 Tax=Parachitinimonas caeni TaxID=3031301 RepID=A0ABT7E118_9NEIS|nr:hypothetical protein [Parachitinimonas caeni]MDK2126020.1 hypothetical protein [Parachitinimonas caeni]
MKEELLKELEALFQKEPVEMSITAFCNDLVEKMKKMGLDYIVMERRHYDALIADRAVERLTKWRGMRIQIVNEGFVSAD